MSDHEETDTIYNYTDSLGENYKQRLNTEDSDKKNHPTHKRKPSSNFRVADSSDLKITKHPILKLSHWRNKQSKKKILAQGINRYKQNIHNIKNHPYDKDKNPKKAFIRYASFRQKELNEQFKAKDPNKKEQINEFYAEEKKEFEEADDSLNDMLDKLCFVGSGEKTNESTPMIFPGPISQFGNGQNYEAQTPVSSIKGKVLKNTTNSNSGSNGASNIKQNYLFEENGTSCYRNSYTNYNGTGQQQVFDKGKKVSGGGNAKEDSRNSCWINNGS